jgi:hypothetical protein
MVRPSSSHRAMALLSAAAGVVSAPQFAKPRRDDGLRPDGTADETG